MRTIQTVGEKLDLWYSHKIILTADSAEDQRILETIALSNEKGKVRIDDHLEAVRKTGSLTILVTE